VVSDKTRREGDEVVKGCAMRSYFAGSVIEKAPNPPISYILIMSGEVVP
jgi:hypothetical protein